MTNTLKAPATETPGKGHRGRLRERFLASGLDGFHDYEVIELLLTLATPRKDCKPAAKAALTRFKSLPAVLEATAGELAARYCFSASKYSGGRFVGIVSDYLYFFSERVSCPQLVTLILPQERKLCRSGVPPTPPWRSKAT